uniref:receptor protein serine/threonine kinase n=1 Tax=Salarias fasciatus TaxID=181472 RepID=A0A672I7U3_SALFA
MLLFSASLTELQQEQCVLLAVSLQSVPQKRRCVFRVTPRNRVRFSAAGTVSSSEQRCENTRCCVGNFWVEAGRAEPQVLACDLVEKSCPGPSCTAQPRFSGIVKCVCNTDFCNGNLSWSPEEEEAPSSSSSSSAGILLLLLFLLLFLLLLLLFLQLEGGALRWRCGSVQLLGDAWRPLQVVRRGRFTTVFKGRLGGRAVAVKVFSASQRRRFEAERRVYRLPLMSHAGILRFLGAGRCARGDGRFLLLQFAQQGSLHSFLSSHSSSWTSSLKLCWSLSRGLSFLHSELLLHDQHKPAVSHGDLSSSSVLVLADGTCVLCDFGSAAVLRPGPGGAAEAQVSPGGGGAWPAALRYAAPEILEGSVNLSGGPGSFRLQGDVYALALLLWEICMRCQDLFLDGVAPGHLLPYELELGATVSLETLVQHVSYMDRRPSVPEHWALLPQGPALAELLTDCWDAEPDARLSAQCVVDRLMSLQSRSSA